MAERRTAAAVKNLAGRLAEHADRLERPPGARPDELSDLEGYVWLLTLFQMAVDLQVKADPWRPGFVDLFGPLRRWGGENPDGVFRYCAVHPGGRYLLRGDLGDAAYSSVSVYGGPADGRMSTRIIDSVNDHELRPGPDGRVEVLVAAGPPDGSFTGRRLRLEADAVCLITRSYLADPGRDRPGHWEVELLDSPDRTPPDDGLLARRVEAAATWLSEQAGLVFALGDDNTITEPYRVGREVAGWAAGDAAYAMGAYHLRDDQALLIRGDAVDCVFWNVVVYNPYLHSPDHGSRPGRTSVNGFQCVLEDDGSWTVVLAHRDPGRPNWISTGGRPRGRLWFRWFLPDRTPDRPRVEVVPLPETAPVAETEARR